MALIKCPECGKDVSSEAEVCIHCGFPLKKSEVHTENKDSTSEDKTRDDGIPENKENIGESKSSDQSQLAQGNGTDNKQQPADSKNGCGRGCLISVLIAVVLVIALFACAAMEGGSDSTASKQSTAVAYAKMAVEEQLKSPSTAEFCKYSQMDITNTSGNNWSVSGYVDAENSFGATVRTYWTVTMTVNGDNATNVHVSFN